MSFIAPLRRVTLIHHHSAHAPPIPVDADVAKAAVSPVVPPRGQRHHRGVIGVLTYLDRFEFKGRKRERIAPAITTLTVEAVKKRIKLEIFSGQFGRGKNVTSVLRKMADTMVEFAEVMAEIGNTRTGGGIIKKTFENIAGMINVVPFSALEQAFMQTTKNYPAQPTQPTTSQSLQQIETPTFDLRLSSPQPAPTIDVPTATEQQQDQSITIELQNITRDLQEDSEKTISNGEQLDTTITDNIQKELFDRVTTKLTLATGGVSTSPVRIDGGGRVSADVQSGDHRSYVPDIDVQKIQCSFELVRRAGYRRLPKPSFVLAKFVQTDRQSQEPSAKVTAHAPLTALQMEGGRSKGVDGVDASTNSDPARSSMVEAGGVSTLGSPLAEATHDPVKGSSTPLRVGVEASKVAGDLVGTGLVSMATATHVLAIDSAMMPKNRGEVSTGIDRDNGTGFVGGSFLDFPSTADGSMVAVATCDVTKDSKAMPRVGPLVPAGLICEKGGVPSVAAGVEKGGVLVIKPTKVASLVFRNKQRKSNKWDGHGSAKPRPFGLNIASKPGKVVVSKSLFKFQSGKKQSATKVLSVGSANDNELTFRTKVKANENFDLHASMRRNLLKNGFGLEAMNSANGPKLGFNRVQPLHNVKHGKHNARDGLGPNKLQSHGFIPGQNGTNSKALHGNGRMLNMGSNYGMLNGKGFAAGTFGVASNLSKTPDTAIRPNLSVVNEIGSAIVALRSRTLDQHAQGTSGAGFAKGQLSVPALAPQPQGLNAQQRKHLRRKLRKQKGKSVVMDKSPEDGGAKGPLTGLTGPLYPIPEVSEQAPTPATTCQADFSHPKPLGILRRLRWLHRGFSEDWGRSYSDSDIPRAGREVNLEGSGFETDQEFYLD
nr:uncharacterized protein LOC109191246 [Ipomoea batatas]